MKKKTKLQLRKFTIAKLQRTDHIWGGTGGNRTDPNDPECDQAAPTEDTQCQGGGN